MDLDAILPDVGEFGAYQQLLLWLVLLPAVLPNAFHAYNQLFMASRPDHWCRHPALDAPSNLSVEVVKQLRSVGGPTPVRRCGGVLAFARSCAHSQQMSSRPFLKEEIWEKSVRCLAIEPRIEWSWNARVGEMGVPRENPPASGIVQHGSHMRKSGSGLARYRARIAVVGGECPKGGRIPKLIEVDLKQGFQKCSFYREKPIVRLPTEHQWQMAGKLPRLVLHTRTVNIGWPSVCGLTRCHGVRELIGCTTYGTMHRKWILCLRVTASTVMGRSLTYCVTTDRNCPMPVDRFSSQHTSITAITVYAASSAELCAWLQAARGLKYLGTSYSPCWTLVQMPKRREAWQVVSASDHGAKNGVAKECSGGGYGSTQGNTMADDLLLPGGNKMIKRHLNCELINAFRHSANHKKATSCITYYVMLRRECSGDMWAALNIEILRADEGEARWIWNNAGMQGRRKREIPDETCRTEENLNQDSRLGSTGMKGRGKKKIPEETRRPAISSDTMPMCENEGASPPGFEPCSPSHLLFKSIPPLAQPGPLSFHAFSTMGSAWICYSIVLARGTLYLTSDRLSALITILDSKGMAFELFLTVANVISSPRQLPDFHKWQSYRTMPFHPPLHSLRFTLIGSQDLVVKSRPDLSTQRPLATGRGSFLNELFWYYIAKLRLIEGVQRRVPCNATSRERCGPHGNWTDTHTPDRLSSLEGFAFTLGNCQSCDKRRSSARCWTGNINNNNTHTHTHIRFVCLRQFPFTEQDDIQRLFRRISAAPRKHNFVCSFVVIGRHGAGQEY
ncbi:hypothetical protein PR048_031736 [Dryococelus australis]|uniref:Uncharacterized protein n=1 Tax=Dryococelus australis TaxID=614101 RepID=A0ABQ9G8X2_9NEOP|nr:hypothetical protein PR048_031736 [Dryococelus australis]